MLTRVRCRLCKRIVCHRGWLRRWGVKAEGIFLTINHIQWHMHEKHGGKAPVTASGRPLRIDFARLDD